MRLSREEINRKLLHLLALLMPICIFFGPGWGFPDLLVPLTLGVLFHVSLLAEILRFRIPAVQKMVYAVFGGTMRQEEKAKISGWTWIVGAAFLCTILFRSTPHVSFMVLSLFVLGDAAAALVGIGIGRIKIGKKSLEGSLACFLVCLGLFFAVFPFVPHLLDEWNGAVPVFIAIATAFVITLFELVPMKLSRKIVINDNFAVPVIAGYVIIGLGKIAG